jgi:short-subunit dehydrogenase
MTNSSMSPHVAITGASSGLGAALAHAYSRPGMLLSLSGRNRERLGDVAARCEAAGAEVRTAICDVTDAEKMAAWLAGADDVRPLDIVYANAGVGGRIAVAPVDGETNEIAHRILATNTIGVINTATPVLPRFAARRSGHFVVISSLAGLLGLPHSPAYCASKAAARVYAEGLRRLMRRHGVRVTIVNAGYIDTPMSRSLPFPGTLTWSAERAAQAIRSAVERNKGEYTFPWPLWLGLATMRLLPNRLVDAILAEVHRREKLS